MHPQQPIQLATARLGLIPAQSPEQWYEQLDWQVAEAVAAGAELLLFPAWGTLGMFHQGSIGERYALLSEELERFIAQLRDLAHAHQRYIVAPGLPVSIAEGRYRHRAHLFAPNGALAFQDQLLVSTHEAAEGIEAGDQLKCFDTELGRLAILVGPDAQHPALARACSDAFAWLLLNPTCDSDPSSAVVSAIAARSRVQECGRYLAQAACGHHLGNSEYHGVAGVYAPPLPGLASDGILGQRRSDGWLHTTLDGERLDELLQTHAAEHISVIDLERPRVIVEESLM